MLQFATPEGLVLLLLAPLLAVLRRVRSRVRPVVLTMFPVMRAKLSRPLPWVPRIFRLAPWQRIALQSMTVALLAAAVGGIRWSSLAPEPGEWLVIFDNTAALASVSAGELSLDGVLQDLDHLLDRFPAGDRVVLLVTSPEPALLAARPDPAEGLARLMPSLVSPPVGEVLAFLSEVAQGRSLRGRLVVSPRGPRWAEELADREDGGLYAVAPSNAQRRGNAGLVAFDLRPSFSGAATYDLSFEVRARGIGGATLPVSLSNEGGAVRQESVALDPSGVGRGEWTDLPLRAGEVVLGLGTQDAFSPDDRVVARIADDQPLPVALDATHRLFFGEALQTNERFRTAAPGEAGATHLYFGEAPETPEGPSVVIAPRGDFLGIRLQGRRDAPGFVEAHPLHPLTRYLAPSRLQVSAVSDYAWPQTSRVLARVGGTALLVAMEVRGVPAVVWNFDPLAAGLITEPEFPILLRDSIEWVSGTWPASWRRAGPCPDGPVWVPWEQARIPGPENLLCASATEEAAAVAVPDLSRFEIQGPPPTTPVVVDLSLPALVLALLLLAYGAVVNAYASGAP